MEFRTMSYFRIRKEFQRHDTNQAYYKLGIMSLNTTC